jgi:predicted nucleotidyltransferase
MPVRIPIDRRKITDFCAKWKVTEFSLFGSVSRDDFGPESDVDVLVSFAPGTLFTMYQWVDMIDELQALFGRPIDLVDESTLKNPFRRHRILKTREVLHAA